MSRPLITLAIPAYNRAQWLPTLLDSALAQDFQDWDCLIIEDGSRERLQIRDVAQRYAAAHPLRFTYHENARNLGYDGNFRELVARARGRYLFVMGNDDVIAPGAFAAVARAVQMAPEMGMLLRTFARFTGDPGNVVQVSRYYPQSRVFPSGPPAIVPCYRRLVAMSGLVLHRDDAHACATDRWDGTLFYQHWLAVNLLRTRPAVFLPDVLALFRTDGTPEFGNASAERGAYTPGTQPPDTDVRMIRSLLAIARDGAPDCYAAIERDYANYIYHTLAHQAHVPRAEFRAFHRELGALGLARHWPFHAWYWAIVLLGAKRLDAFFQVVRRTVGHTPNLTRAAR
ncbi:MAG: glycosyltransferase family 2 protein [Verrucomicrobia bacterium]|nr:glycosyltransferase family 2 protein [Verrucomicrobiota bacterium]